MRFFHSKSSVAAFISILFTSTVQAEKLSVGAAALVTVTPYREYKTEVEPIPIINFENENFYIRNLAAGYYLWNNKQSQLSITAFYHPQKFKPGDSDDENLRRLDRRNSTLMGGLEYSYNAEWGTLRSTLSGDMLNNSNGILGDVSYLYHFTHDRWTLVPRIGVTWSSSNQTEYYYGVNENESRRSGLERYSPGNSWDPYVQLAVNYNLNPNWNVFASARYVRLSSEVKDSPMVDKSYTSSFVAGFSYIF